MGTEMWEESIRPDQLFPSNPFITSVWMPDALTSHALTSLGTNRQQRVDPTRASRGQPGGGSGDEQQDQHRGGEHQWITGADTTGDERAQVVRGAMGQHRAEEGAE